MNFLAAIICVSRRPWWNSRWLQGHSWPFRLPPPQRQSREANLHFLGCCGPALSRGWSIWDVLVTPLSSTQCQNCPLHFIRSSVPLLPSSTELACKTAGTFCWSKLWMTSCCQCSVCWGSETCLLMLIPCRCHQWLLQNAAGSSATVLPPGKGSWPLYNRR